MRPILTILLFLLLAMLAACVSDGDDSKTDIADPLVAMYHGALAQSLAEGSQNESSDDEQPGQNAEDQQRASKTELTKSSDKKGPAQKDPGNGQTLLQPVDSRPWLVLEPRHQSLIYESAPLPDKTAQPEPGQERGLANQTNRGDPLLGTYHRQITAAPLSDDLALNINADAEGQSEKPRPAIGSKPGLVQNQKLARPQEDEQSQLQSSLHLKPANKAPMPETKPAKRDDDEPTLVNPPEQTGPSQIWIEQVDFIEATSQIIIEIQLNGKVSPNIFVLDEDGDQPTLVLDFPGVIGRGFPRRIGAPLSIATDIRMANHPKKARVVVDLIPHKDYEVQPAWLKGQNKILISISLI